jgi:hypothetical protein
MKGLISMLLSILLIGLLVVVLLRKFGGDEQTSAEPTQPPTPRFLRLCKETAPAKAHGEIYCRCLWKRGITNLSVLYHDPQKKKLAQTCQQQASR